MTPEERAELRLLAKAANAGAVQAATYERDWPLSSRAVGQFLRALNPDLALELLDAAAERDALAAKVERVRALHFGEYVEDEDRNRCFECGDDWPCPTVRALDEEPRP